MRETNRRDFLKEMAVYGAALPLLSAGKSDALWIKPNASGRETINLGNSSWRFSKSDPYPSAKKASFDDSTWEEVGVPHCFNDMDTYQNISQNKAFQGTVWYRKHFHIEPKDKGTFRRNQLYGPGDRTVDFSVQKNVHLTERLTMELHGDAFNVFNTPQFNNPNANVDDPSTFGKLTSTKQYSNRQLQLAARLTF